MGLKNYKYPSWITLQVIDSCNLRCAMCYEWGENGAYHGKKAKMLNIGVLERIVKDCAPGQPYYALFGGEPMMYPWLGEAISVIREHGSRVDIPTNGMFLKKRADVLCNAQPNRIWVSLDGPEAINDAQRGKGVYAAVQEGMQTLFNLRESKDLEYPRLGYTFIVTPLTCPYVREFVENAIDLDRIDHLSIECQTFITEEMYLQQRDLFKRLFGVPDTLCAKGLVQDLQRFSHIDTESLAEQIKWVRGECEERGIYFVTYPKTIDAGNYSAYFRKDLEGLSDQRTRCFFPWMYLEVGASGDVTPCHTFYDHAVGNVNEKSILDIWTGQPLQQLRSGLIRNGLFPACSGCARYYADPNRH
jgi:radical SAM protein with 4Fe4S-binding SPASM domain